MADACILYYITDRATLADDEPTRRRRLLEKIAEAEAAGVDYIQLREKDLPTRDLEALAREAVGVIRKANLRTENRQRRTALLINSRTDIALEAGADGVHLRSDDISPHEVITLWAKCAAAPCRAPVRAFLPQSPVIAVSCHSPGEVTQGAANGASFAVFAPVFEKRNAPPTGLSALKQVCQSNIPVLALGGVTLENARSCLEAGAAGIAAIRLFQENDVATIVRALRS
jgi:thiamine-phosphate pyrophosphorylase